MKSPNIKIVEYSDELKEHIKVLNYEWLEKYFWIEESDEKILSNPKEEIIDKGGKIYFAMMNEEVIGTVSLIPKEEGVFELSKMAVTSNVQGQGIGKQLLEACLKGADDIAASRLVLYSHSTFKNALHLYEKYGFTRTTLELGTYERADVKMERVL